MASRMEKYYQDSEDTNSRTARNASLYDEIYDNVKYSNVEDVLKIEKINEIDILKIKEFIQDYEQQKNNEPRIVKKIVTVDKVFEDLDDDGQYDLKQVLATAKKERPKEERERYVRNIKYQFSAEPLDEALDSDIKFNDLTSTAVLKELGDCELSLDLLDSLKDDGTHEDEITIQQNVDKEEMDDSFYTSSMHFSREDFEELDDINKNLKKNNIWITLLVFIILVIVITACLFLFDNIL